MLKIAGQITDVTLKPGGKSEAPYALVKFRLKLSDKLVGELSPLVGDVCMLTVQQTQTEMDMKDKDEE